MKNHGSYRKIDFVEGFLSHKWKELNVHPSLLKLLLDGQETGWHAIKKLFNLPFLIFKVRYPEIWFIIQGGYSKEFK